MATARRGYQHTRPLFIDRLDAAGTARPLERLPLARREAISQAHDEAWLQKLIYDFPQLLPVSEIEPGFGTLLPVCMELSTSSGYVDNLYVTETGNLALAECKLWRNPEARRQVVTQIIDYAHSMARWSYEELEAAVRSGQRPDGQIDGGLFSLFGEGSELDESAFIDAVSRNLRLGRILLLIVGDGIREGVETLTEYLQMHAGFHFALGIVEMPIFELPDHGFFVQPRVLARTVNIERGIVRLVDGQVTIEPQEGTSGKSTSAQRTSISQDRLLEMLAATTPQLPEALKTFLENAGELGVFVEPAAKSIQLRWRGPDDVVYALGGIDQHGKLLTDSVNWKPNQINEVDLSHEYLERLASLVGGTVRRTQSPTAWYVVRDGKRRGYNESLPQAIDLLSRPNEWLETVRWYTGRLGSAIESKS